MSLHNVYLEKITCCLFYETRHVYSTVLFRSASLTCRQFDMITVCDFSLQGGNLQLAMTFSQTSPPWGEKVHSKTPSLCIFFGLFLFPFHGWKSEPKLVFEPLLFDPQFCRCTEKCFFFWSLHYLFSVCYLYTTGFEINNLAIIRSCGFTT